MGHGGLTQHGFRSTFRDWAGETTDHQREVIEHALAHQLADKTEAAYQRGTLWPKRVALMDDWAGPCLAVLLQTPPTRRSMTAVRTFVITASILRSVVP